MLVLVVSHSQTLTLASSDSKMVAAMVVSGYTRLMYVFTLGWMVTHKNEDRAIVLLATIHTHTTGAKYSYIKYQKPAYQEIPT